MSPRLRNVFLGSAALLAIGAASLPVFEAAAPRPAIAQTATATGPMSFADVVERVRPAVVSVRVTRTVEAQQMQFGGPRAAPGFEDEDGPKSPMERFQRRFGERGMPGQGPRGGQRGSAQGSGFFISADGFVVTNNHVVEGAREAELVLDGGRVVKARVVGTDPRTDLALLKAEGSGYSFVPFAKAAPRVGDWVIAVGNPFGLGGTVTAGIVSARGRDIGSGPYDDYLQIDAPINRGNSGGPTFNTAGEVIGVNTAIFSPSGGNVGIAFAIPSETTQTVVAALRDGGTVQRGWIGIQVQPVTAEIAEGLRLAKPEGALVAAIQPDSPAARADLRPSDVITAVNGEAIRDARELTRRIGAIRPGATVKLTVTREGRERTVDLALGELPGQNRLRADAGRDRGSADQGGADMPRLGLSLAPASRVPGAGREGVAVTDVDPNGPAARRGIRPGDVIVDIGGRAVSSLADIRQALQEARADGRRQALVRLRSGEGVRFVAVPLTAG